MKRMTKIGKLAVALLLLLCAVVSFTACGGTVTYDDAKGMAGQLTWDYKASEKTLYINGAGDMPDSESSTVVPWYSIRGGVETVKMTGNITSLGNYAFYGMSALKSVEVPKTVTKIGNYAFAFASLAEITLPEGLVSIGNGAFESCAQLKNIVLPLSVKTIGTRCFAFCSALTDAVLVSKLDAIPEEAFYRCLNLNNLVLHPTMQGKLPDSALVGAGVTQDKIAYREEKVALYKLTVVYEYADGSQALEPYVETLEKGERYNHLVPTIEGYQPDRTAVSDTIGDKDKTERVVYREVKVEEEAAPAPEAPAPEENKPQEEGFTVGTAIALVALVVLIVAIVVGGIWLVRMDKKDTKKKPAPKSNKKK